MYPVIEVGGLALPTFQVMLWVVAGIAYMIGAKGLAGNGYGKRLFLGFSLLAVPLALFGARTLCVLEELLISDTPSGSAADVLYDPFYLFDFSRGGYSSSGAYVAVVLLLWFYSRREARIWLLADRLTPTFITTHILIRVFGCFLAGCCHGRPAYGLALAVTFNHPQTGCLYRGIPVHPTQLYEAFGLLLILAAVIRMRPRVRFSGQLAATYVLLYACLRFFLEFVRADSLPLPGGLSFIQWLSLAAVAVCLYLLTRHRFPTAQGEMEAGEARS